MRAGGEPDGRRLRGPGDAERGGGHEERPRRGQPRPGPAELAAIVAVGEPEEREPRLDEQLRQEPGEREERERGEERRADPEPDDGQHHEPELDDAEREREPARLVGQERMEDEVEREPGRDHRACERERPPGAEGEREARRRERGEERRRKPRLHPASQREGHACTLRRKPRAANFIPTSVSAAG